MWGKEYRVEYRIPLPECQEVPFLFEIPPLSSWDCWAQGLFQLSPAT